MQLYSSLSILWHCLFLGLDENWPFPVLRPLLSFLNLLAYWVQHFLFFFNFYFYFILLYNTVLVLPNIDMNPPRVYMSSQSWTPSHLPRHIISLDYPHAPAPSILYPVSNTDWRFVSYMIVYMFQCHPPKSSHPLPLPQSPFLNKVCWVLSRPASTVFAVSAFGTSRYVRTVCQTLEDNFTTPDHRQQLEGKITNSSVCLFVFSCI